MRMPWNKSKSVQLDLLDTASAEESCVPQPMVVGISVTTPPLVAVSAVYEDPNNPRTELPEEELNELAEDIRQRGILQPIVVHPADEDGRYRIHFGSKRWRAAQRAGLAHVPVVVRDGPADPYAQVAENLKRHGLTPLDLARFIRGRIEAGESNSNVARHLGLNLTTVAHHLSLLDLPPVLEDALKSGRCTSPRTLHELGRLHADSPGQVQALLASGAEITRATVSTIRIALDEAASTEPVASPRDKLIVQANAACDRLERALSRIKPPDTGTIAAPELSALRSRVEAIAKRWLQGSDRPTPSQTES